MRRLLIILFILIILFLFITMLYFFYPSNYGKIKDAQYNYHNKVINSQIIDDFVIKDVELYYYKKNSVFAFNICNKTADDRFLTYVSVHFYYNKKKMFTFDSEVNSKIISDNCMIISFESNENLLNVDEVSYEIKS